MDLLVYGFPFAGFIKFLGPYYMLLITKRRQIGAICGHTVYAVTKSEMIALPNPSVRSNVINPKNENRSFLLIVNESVTLTEIFAKTVVILLPV